MPRAGLDRATVIADAAALVDEAGLEALSLATLATRLGVKAPSLYKHVDGLGALRAGVAVVAKDDLATALERATAGLAGADAVRALATTYRAWAHEHPGQYPLTIVAADASDAGDTAASERLYTVVAAALRSLGLAKQDEVDVIRRLRAALHGFVSLESAGGFGMPQDVQRSFDGMVDSLVVGIG
ncbi:TetR/AcrR family transcriptional regulator [Microbacterium sp. GXF7504]